MLTSNNDCLRLQVALLGFLIAAASSQTLTEADFTPPPKISAIAQGGLELHGKFGGGKNLTIAKKLAKGSKLTLEEIDVMQEFFRNGERDENACDFTHNLSVSDTLCFQFYADNLWFQLKAWIFPT
jgi:hypothetical protein